MIDSVVISHVTAAAVSVAFINWLKKSEWFPWITQEKARVMRAVALLTAAAASIGIAYTWDPAARLLSFHIPTLVAVVGMAVGYVKSFAIQELTYQATKKPNVGELVAAVVAALKPGSAPIVEVK